MLFILVSCSKYDQINQTVNFDGENYTIHTYSTGLFNIPKQALDLYTQTTNPEEISTIKKNHWEISKKFVDNYDNY